MATTALAPHTPAKMLDRDVIQRQHRVRRVCGKGTDQFSYDNAAEELEISAGLHKEPAVGGDVLIGERHDAGPGASAAA